VIRALRWAVAFLTILPVAPRGAPRAGELGRSAAFFPLVGALVACACFAADLALSGRVPGLVRGLLVVAWGAILTRALHLDGLADAADGLACMKGRERALDVMRDPHVGAFGALALVIVVLVQAASLSEVSADARLAGLVAAATSSRFVMALAGFAFPYARERGTGAGFAGCVPAWALAFACAFGAGGTRGLVLLGVGTAGGLAFAALAAVKFRGVTGDVLGASGEVAQTVALVWATAQAGAAYAI